MATYNNVWFQSTNSTFVHATATYSVVSSDAEYHLPSTLSRRKLPAISFITLYSQKCHGRRERLEGVYVDCRDFVVGDGSARRDGSVNRTTDRGT